MEENQFQEISKSFTAPTARLQKRFPKRTVVLVAFVILIVLAFGFMKLSGKSKNQQTTTASVAPSATPIESGPSATPIPSPSESPTPSPTPTPTPKPSVNPVDKATGLDRSTLSVIVQNGSGQVGVAGKAADYLKNLGYNVVSTGNADNYNYTNVFIQVKAGKSDFLSLLKKDLGFNYTIGTNSADLSDSSSEDALVIIGQ